MTSEAAMVETTAMDDAPKHSNIQRLAAITLGSLMFVCLKTGIVALIHYLTGMPAWLNYLIVTISVSILGWIYHSKVSFQIGLSRRTLIRYVQQAIALKIADYAIYNGLVYLASTDIRLAVVITGGIVFTTRVFVYVKYVFVGHPPAVAAAEAEGMRAEETDGVA